MPLRQPSRRLPPPSTSAYRLAGMHGLGDNLHQRAVVRQLMERRPVWLETTWPCVYHDLVGPRLHLIYKGSPVPTYKRNAERERAQYSSTPIPADAWPMKVFYTPALVRSCGSVLGGMCNETDTSVARADFRLPIQADWDVRAARLLEQWNPTKPLLIYRPLVERSWWGGCIQRNPEHATYAQLFRAIRDKFFVVSVADFHPGEEWFVGEPVDADITLHAGELDFETLAALTARAQLVFTSPGFAVILAQAVGTPSCVVFGGFENASSFSVGGRFAPYLAIEPITPCQCFSHHHACDKRIDVDQALNRIHDFLSTLSARPPLSAAA